MKKDLKKKLISRKIKKPNPIIMTIISWLLGFLNKKYTIALKFP